MTIIQWNTKKRQDESTYQIDKTRSVSNSRAGFSGILRGFFGDSSRSFHPAKKSKANKRAKGLSSLSLRCIAIIVNDAAEHQSCVWIFRDSSRNLRFQKRRVPLWYGQARGNKQAGELKGALKGVIPNGQLHGVNGSCGWAWPLPSFRMGVLHGRMARNEALKCAS